jgi:hypothetical protein
VTVGAIDPEQRRIAERLVFAALRRFHREQPLAADLRIDSLVARVQSASRRRPPPRHRGSTPMTLDDLDLRRVIEDMAADGRLVRCGRRVRLPDANPGLEPEMQERVDRLIEGLRSAGADPPRIDGIAARLGIPPGVIDQLRAAGILRHIGPGIDYPSDVWASIHARLGGLPGQLTVARVRDTLHTSRRHAEAIIAAFAATPRRGPDRRSPGR